MSLDNYAALCRNIVPLTKGLFLGILLHTEAVKETLSFNGQLR